MLSNQVKIIPITKTLVDVFHGEEGWDQWTRVKVEKSKGETILHPKKGSHMNVKTAKEVMNYVSSMH